MREGKREEIRGKREERDRIGEKRREKRREEKRREETISEMITDTNTIVEEGII